MAREIAFTTYLKLLQLNAQQRKAELKKMLSGTGFRYWSPIKEIAPSALKPGADLKLLEEEIEKRCTSHRRKHNKNALKALYDWAQGKDLKEEPLLPELTVSIAKSGLSVKLKPEVSFEMDGKLFAMALWPTTKPPITKETLTMGLLIMRLRYRAKKYNDHDFLVLDTVGNVLVDNVEDESVTLIRLKEKHEAIEKDWIELNGPPPAPPPGKPKTDDDYTFPPPP